MNHHRDDQSSAPFEKKQISTSVKTALAFIGFIVAIATTGAIAWTTLKAESAMTAKAVADLAVKQNVEQVALDRRVSDQHDTLLLLGQTVQQMDKKLDYLTGARRERPPAGSALVPAAGLGSVP